MAGTATLMALKASNQAQQSEETSKQERSRDTLVLVMDYLTSNGYSNTASSLKAEGGATLSRYEGADNVDLHTIFHDFEEYYQIKFGRKPKLTRRSMDGDDDDDTKFARSSLSKHSDARRRKSELEMQKRKEVREKARKRSGVDSGVLGTIERKLGVSVGGGGGGGGLVGSRDDMSITASQVGKEKKDKDKEDDPFQVGGSAMQLKPAQEKHAAPVSHDETPVMNVRLLKPLPNFGGDIELRALGETIQRDILQTSPDVKWEDVIDLDEAKRLLKEAVVMPIKYPQLFTGLLSPWCGILLYGPPGTGKTMLAKAVASECNTTFFNISASSIVSKYRGDSEKLIRVLFELARRMKTELLIQMDGLSRGTEHVFVLAASNLPWDLDSALLRRLEKRVLVPLPEKAARLKMLEMHMGGQTCDDLDLDGCAASSEGFSGADIKLLCKEAAMRPVRRLLGKLERMESTEGLEGGVVEEAKVRELVEGNPVTQDDLDKAIAVTNKSGGGGLEKKYEAWAKAYGST
ncbi:hypothetical protein TrCOL_g3576 [Triparma columacea]|uniref:AAA+ ATPase domain-containing protein n=1 Tax=Triparma columacea TaxID=722753 RepID=A0A9W7LAF9_9STRA|nr:hypothetical protein TrCOL_g3576 [Triparma columacea]